MTDVGAAETSRLFIGIALTDAAREALLARLPSGPLPGRCVPPPKWHLTLRFLGDTAPDMQYRLRAGMREAVRDGWFGRVSDIVFDRMGAFPRPTRSTVLWIGVRDGAERLSAMTSVVEHVVRGAGFEAETRAFTPHLTLSRLHPPRDLAALLDGTPPFDVRMTVDALVLFRSHPGGGAVGYEQVERFPLSHP